MTLCRFSAGLVVCLFACAALFSGEVCLAARQGNCVNSEKKHTELHQGEQWSIPGIPSCLISPRSQKRVADLYVSPELAYQYVKNAGALIIDVSPSHDFEKRHIPKSLNIPLFSVKYQKFLKHRHIILVNQGGDLASLEHCAAELKDLGFNKVSVIKGGLAAWYRAQLPVGGDPQAWKSVAVIQPISFWADRNYDDWKIIVICSGAQYGQVKKIFPQSECITASRGSPEKSEVLLGEYLKRKFPKGYQGYVLVTNMDGDYRNLRKIGESFPNLFYLKGGIRGYIDFLMMQAAIKKDHNRKSDRSQGACGCQ